MKFDKAHDIVVGIEKGYVNDPRDPGGATKFGISLRFLRSIGLDINRDGIIDGLDIRGLTHAEAKKIYYTKFWLATNCQNLPNGIDLAVFDCAVNQGRPTAIKLLQRSARVKVDGIIGPKTLAAVKYRSHTVLQEFSARRGLRYAMNLKILIFGLGWFRRLIYIHSIASTHLNGDRILTSH